MKKLVYLLPLLFISCVDPNYNSGGGYYDPYDRYDRYDDYDRYDRYEDERERRKLERERDRLEEERRRLEEERRRKEKEYSTRPIPPPPPPPRVERCPSGFTPSENKCSREERKRGCQDMRLPGGLGCVKR